MEIKPARGSMIDSDSGMFFDPYSKGTGKPVCCCGYELLLESDGNVFRCAGGNHRYVLKDGDFVYDKYGNVLLKIPEGDEKNGKNEKKP